MKPEMQERWIAGTRFKFVARTEELRVLRLLKALPQGLTGPDLQREMKSRSGLWYNVLQDLVVRREVVRKAVREGRTRVRYYAVEHKGS